MLEFKRNTAHFLLLLGAALFFPFASGQGNMCGTPAPDPMKTCISIRLPWQPEPLYFCIEKEKFRYRNQCFSGQTYCGSNLLRNDTLIVATPWNCCPYASTPDHCMIQNCPPPPMGRTCKEVGNMDGGSSGWGNWGGDCCPKYFCEEGVAPEACEMKRLDPTCVNPPQGKMNCVGFHDPFGCCTKYQCDGEGKPGLCHMQHQALQIQMRMNTTHSHFMNMTAMGGAAAGAATAKSQIEPGASPIHLNSGIMLSIGGKRTACISDTNCPGAQKCCSHDMSVYGAGRFMMRNVNPTHGYCEDPVMMQPIATS